MYIEKRITWGKLRDSIIDYKPWYKEPKKIDSSRFRREFMRVEDIFNNITQKRLQRKRKEIR